MSDSINQDRVSTWDENKTAEALFGPDGGVAVWVRREEVLARAVLRGGGDLVQAAMDIASLRMGIEKLIETIAAHHGVMPAQLEHMAGLAEETMRPATAHAARIMPRPN